MGLLSRLMGAERRSALPTPSARVSDPFLADLFGLRGRAGRTHASPDEAVACLAVAARCVSLIAEGLASLPCRVYRWTDDGGRVLDLTHPLDVLLNDVANPTASAFSVREGLAADVLTYGNGYLRQDVDSRGRVSALWYLPRPWVGVERLPSGRLRYRISEPSRGTYVLTADEVVHLRYRTRDGVMGVAPLEWAGAAVGLAVSQSDLAQSLADRGFTPDLAFTMDGQFGDEQTGQGAFNRLKGQLMERVGKMSNRAAPLVLESGLKAQQLAPSGRESQFHELRQAGLADVARVFGVPLSVLGLNAAASYGSLTEESRALVQNCFRPWARRIESELMRTLLTANGRRNFAIEHDMTGLLAGNMGERFEVYATAVQNELLSPDECRLREGLNRRPDGQGGLFRNPATTGTGDRAPAASSSPEPVAPQASAQPAEA